MTAYEFALLAARRNDHTLRAVAQKSFRWRGSVNESR
jgi:hypothetical protein